MSVGDFMKALFVVNPVAGKGKALEIIKSFEPFIRNEISYQIEITKYKGQATEIVRSYTSREDYIVFSVGGDGTLNEVVNGIVGTKSSLAIIPAGSGNDFIRSVYEPHTIEELLIELIKGTDYPIDVIEIGKKHFLNIASVGLDADIVYNASRYKKLRFVKGDLAYIISLFKSIFGKKGIQAKVTIDGKEICNQDILLLAVANGSFYGGGIPIMPIAKVNDALADICLVREVRLRKLIKVLPSVFRAQHIHAKEVEVYHGKEIKIESETLCRLNIDGEITTAQEIDIKLIPQGVNIRLPRRNHLIKVIQ